MSRKERTLKKRYEVFCEKEHYDIEHTLSLDDAVEDLTIVCRNKLCNKLNTYALSLS